MKRTILSPKQTELLEGLIAKYGQIVTSEEIYSLAENEEAERQLKKIITKLVKSGWLIRIRKGLYAISDLSNRGFLSLSPYVVANLLVKDSYVSFESALSYRGMFDQLTNKIISISKVRVQY
jgi:predicted transcriptional regulator of viral defense system